MRDRMSEIFWHPVTAASRAHRFPTTWPRNDGLWGRECHKQENCRRHQSSWSQTTVNKSSMRCLRIQMWSVWYGLCWLYSPTPFPTHCWTQALSYWKTPAWLSQSGEQRPPLNNSLYWRNVVGNLNAWSTKCFLSRKRNPNWTLNQTQ